MLRARQSNDQDRLYDNDFAEVLRIFILCGACRNATLHIHQTDHRSATSELANRPFFFLESWYLYCIHCTLDDTF